MITAVENDRSLAEVLHDVIGNLDRMVRAEIRLAKAEAVEEAGRRLREVGVPARSLIAGILLAQLGFAFLLLSGVYALSNALPVWLAAFIVAAPTTAAAGVLIVIALRQLKELTATVADPRRDTQEKAR